MNKKYCVDEINFHRKVKGISLPELAKQTTRSHSHISHVLSPGYGGALTLDLFFEMLKAVGCEMKISRKPNENEKASIH